MALEFHISPGSSTPIYRQIIDQVRKGVVTGSWSEGDQLPSVRALAEQLVINPNTVAHAYAELVRNGVAESKPGKGLFVTKRRQIFSKEERLRRLNEALDQFLGETVFLDFSLDEIQAMLERKRSKIRTISAGKKGGAND
mgnify:CR=1 FL=1